MAEESDREERALRQETYQIRFMNFYWGIVCTAFLLQAASALLSVRLLFLPGKRLAGVLALIVFSLMASERLVSLLHVNRGGMTPFDHVSEIITLVIAFILLVGVWYVTGLVVSERTMAESLSESRERYQTLFDQSPNGIVLIDQAGSIIEFNEAAHRELGYTREEFSRLRLSDIDAGETPEEIRKSMEDILRNGRAEFEVKHRTKSGEIRDVEVITQVLSLSGRPVFHTIWRDITERKRGEEALSESENRYHLLFDQSPDGILLINEEGKIVEFNESAHRQLGYTRAEFSRLGIADIDPFENPEEVQRRIKDIFNTGQAEFDVKHRTKGGEIRDVHATVQAIRLSGVPMVHGLWHDITERKKAEEAKIRSEKRFHALFDSTPLGIVMVGPDRTILDCNEAFQKMLGYSLEELKALSVPEISDPEDDRATRAYYKEMMEGKIDSFSMEKRHVRKDGSTLWTNLTGTVVRDEKGGPQLVFGIVEDISGRKKMEEALRNSRDFIERILDTVDEAFIVIDRDYKIIMANNAYGDQVGMPVEQIVGRRCHEISHQSEIPCFEAGEDCSVRHCFETGEPHSCVHRHTSKDGSVLYVETKAFPLKDAAGNVASAIEVISNITDKHLLEEQILRTQKLEAVGLLAGGIAHDFNNLLQGVFGSISIAKMFSDSGGKTYEMLERAEQALSLATNLTKQLLTFSKGGEPLKKVVALPSVINDSAKFALSGSNVDFRYSSDKDLWAVEADEGQISQVIHNIILNASEAMPDGGTVVLEMRNVEVNEKSGLPLEKGKYVRTDITDSGQGILPQYHSRIFDPYFSTKKRGSGLGLATSYSILKKHGGLITVESQAGRGSTFSVYLPAVERLPAPVEIEHGRLFTGRGRILVLDDEEVVRTISTHMLESLGYEVDTAENGEKTIAKYAEAMESGRPFSAVILDLTVRGGMGGRDTLERLLEIDPSVRAIVSSGYSGDDILSNYKEYGFTAVLSKPYQIEELSRLLHGLLYTESPS